MTAVFSDCGRYRYRLDRELPYALGSFGRVVFACLNPSIAGRVIAGKEITDPSATRLAGFTRSWGYGAFTIVNVFGYIATDPAALTKLASETAVGPDNIRHIREAIDGAALVVAAWGSSYPSTLAVNVEGARDWLMLQGPVHHLGLTKSGDPKHPLYLRGDTQPTRWDVAA